MSTDLNALTHRTSVENCPRTDDVRPAEMSSEGAEGGPCNWEAAWIDLGGEG